MKLKEVKFDKSVSINNDKVFFEDKKEIVFVWRSNVGKSSIMNALLDKKDLVKTSSTPGKTRLANIFVINNKVLFTDLPWYWFAKMGKEFLTQLDSLISWYIEERRQNLQRVVILIDSRLWAQQVDIDMYKYLQELDLPVLIVLSKTDKLSNNELAKSIKWAEEAFFGQKIVPYSSLTKDNHKELFKAVFDWL